MRFRFGAAGQNRVLLFKSLIDAMILLFLLLVFAILEGPDKTCSILFRHMGLK